MSWSCLRRTLPVLLAAFVLAACGTIPSRNPMPQPEDRLAPIPGLPEDARFWGDQTAPELIEGLRAASPAEVRAGMPSWSGQKLHFLAISGGGQHGAFGAGLVNGWTASGTRPEFQIVTGVSTGALSAPFVFLGPDYDDELEEIYTSFTQSDLIERRSWTVIATGDAAVGTAGLRALIASYVDDEMIRRLSAAHALGRGLFIGTTNLDASRPVIWNITMIAASDHPDKKELIVDVLLASASIPGAFPPVVIDIPVGDETFDELHVDGGTVAQVFVYPSSFDMPLLLDKLGNTEPFEVYIIRNAQLSPAWEPVAAGILSISRRSIASLIRAQGQGDLSTIYLVTERDGGNFNLVYIPDDFADEPAEQFDREYMQALYNLGYSMAKDGIDWAQRPPAVETLQID